jgi:hypothetical protein
LPFSQSNLVQSAVSRKSDVKRHAKIHDSDAKFVFFLYG